jgi:hypothetical protein
MNLGAAGVDAALAGFWRRAAPTLPPQRTRVVTVFEMVRTTERAARSSTRQDV